MKKYLPLLLACALLVPAAAHANGFFLAGHAYCEITGLELPGVTIHVSGNGFSADGTTDANGYYEIALPIDGGTFTATAVLDVDETVVFPASGAYNFTTSPNDPYLYLNWVIASPTCSKPEGLCWLTAGGARISNITGEPVAEDTRRWSFGGNVYPGCSATAGLGGQWNLIDDLQKLHFQAFSCHVERCGNVDGIPPGSDSPVTPFNFIEWTGVGRIQGIRGNKVKIEPAYCWARCEDRNEPGSSGQRDGALKDRFYIQVFTNPLDPNGSTIMLIDGNGVAADKDPVPITDGNLQLHISSCDGITVAQRQVTPDDGRTTSPVSNEFWFATSPNPVNNLARITFGLPRDGRVSFNVFDVGGRLVRQITDESMSAGQHTIEWNLQDGAGLRVRTGMYFLQMKVNGGLSRTSRIAIN